MAKQITIIDIKNVCVWINVSRRTIRSMCPCFLSYRERKPTKANDDVDANDNDGDDDDDDNDDDDNDDKNDSRGTLERIDCCRG